MTTNGDTTTIFPFTASLSDGNGFVFSWSAGPHLLSGAPYVFDSADNINIFTEEVPAGWVLTKVECVGTISVDPVSTFTYITGGVIIHYVAGDGVTCTFTNSPIRSAVGGVVIPANNACMVAPWLLSSA